MFHPELVSFLKLLERSRDEGGGWRTYTEAMRNLVFMNKEKFPGLFVVDEGRSTVKTTAEGGVLVKWMNFNPDKK